LASLDVFSERLKTAGGAEHLVQANASGHFAPLWGVVCAAMRIELGEAAYVFMLNHAKAVLSAAVRASVIGPYRAQAVLASEALREVITHLVQMEWETEPEDAGQVVPVLDLWVGRHELLYSRIFNS
jgi:urease accessory protein